MMTTANSLLSLSVTEFSKSVSIGQSSGQKYSVSFFESQCTVE